MGPLRGFFCIMHLAFQWIRKLVLVTLKKASYTRCFKAYEFLVGPFRGAFATTRYLFLLYTKIFVPLRLWAAPSQLDAPGSLPLKNVLVNCPFNELREFAFLVACQSKHIPSSATTVGNHSVLSEGTSYR